MSNIKLPKLYVRFLNMEFIVYRNAKVVWVGGKGHHIPLAALHLQHMQFKPKPSMLKHFSPIILQMAKN